MIKLKPYEEYRKSNLHWLNKYPTHWEIKRAKLMFDVIDIRSETGKEELLSVSARDGVIKRSDANVTMFKAESYIGYKLCWPKDLAVNSLWAWQKGLGFSKYHGIISTAYGVYRLKNHSMYNCKYYDYYVRSSAYSWELRVRSRGIWKSRYQLTDARFLDSPMICPPKEEQDQIVRFLDSKILKINKFIKNKKKLIELLKEKKQAIINQAVTKGLDPNVKMKPSGIEWLGDVPEGWLVCKLKSIGSFKSGINLTSLEISEKGDYPVYGGNGLRGFYNMATHNGKHILIGRQGALCGNAHLIQGPFWATEHAIVVTNYEYIDIDWAYYMISAMNLNQYSQSAAQPGLSVDKIVKLPTIMPPLFEQKNIASYIGMQLERIDKTINRITKEIELITEYRTSLISAVVTGQVDVRDVPVEEPQEVLEEQLEAMSEVLPVDEEIPESEAI